MKKEKNNFFIYAIREILLVVIGILIAVTINNWNEKRQQNKELSHILLNIKEDIKNDIEKIDTVLEGYEKRKLVFDNILNSKFSVKDYEENPKLGFILLGYPEISFSKRGVSILEKFNGNIGINKEAVSQEIIEFYNEQLWEIKVDDELRAEDFKENFKYWKNNTEWWSDYVSLKITEDFIKYAINSKDYKNRVATARFYAYQVYLPEIKKFKKKGLEIIKNIEQIEN